jgi:tetratricopeptide (TPR) repeat protein
LQRYKEAIACFDQGLQLKPDDHQAWFNQGNALGNLGEIEQAIACFDQGLQLKPDDHQAWFNRGILAVGVGLGIVLVILSVNLIQNPPCTYKFANQPTYVRE